MTVSYQCYRTQYAQTDLQKLANASGLLDIFRSICTIEESVHLEGYLPFKAREGVLKRESYNVAKSTDQRAVD